jgi:hypothetical protein
MGSTVYKVSLIERSFDFIIHKLALSAIFIASFFSQFHTDGLKHSQHLSGPVYEISFAQFSPAFAAFEDDYLFTHEAKAAEEFLIVSGESPQLFHQLIKDESIELKETPQNLVKTQPALFSQFDGGTNISAIDWKTVEKKKAIATTNRKITQTPPNKKANSHHEAGELKFGPLFASVPNQQNRPNTEVAKSQSPGSFYGSSKSKPQESLQNDQVSFEEKAFEVAKKHTSYRLSGHISLQDGLAYFGTLEAAWVVGDEVIALGSVNIPDAFYEIEVGELIGDIIVSLYDNSDSLIGEGIIDLQALQGSTHLINHDVEVHPINWDDAGQILHVHSFGANSNGDGPKTQPIPISDVEVQLYSFNLASKTNGAGHFSFKNWKRLNSRTLAIASKPGYRDSIFILDSRSEATVPLLTNTYVDAFFDTLSDQGLHNRENYGTIYGVIQGESILDGYEVKLHNHNTIYFNSLNMADLGLSSTSQNGLFTFVGLDDGDYELSIIKHGEVIDHRVVAVEQGKISPLLVDLKRVYKHLEFFDPMDPEFATPSVDISFFDGVGSVQLDQAQRLQQSIPKGNDPNMVEYSVGKEVGRTFISRQRGLERLPVLASDQLHRLADDQGMHISSGLVFGFIRSQSNYTVTIVEGGPEKVVYFNDAGVEIDPSEEIPYGFIMGGFFKGISTLSILDSKKNLLASDIIYSDHSSISVVNTTIY